MINTLFILLPFLVGWIPQKSDRENMMLNWTLSDLKNVQRTFLISNISKSKDFYFLFFEYVKVISAGWDFSWPGNRLYFCCIASTDLLLFETSYKTLKDFE